MIMKVEDKKFKGASSLEEHYLPLMLSGKDEISVEELSKEDCPVWVKGCLKKLLKRGIKKVFFKREGEHWAFSLKKDSLN